MIRSFVLENNIKYEIDPETRELKKVGQTEKDKFRTLIVEEIIDLEIGKEPKIMVTVIDKGYEDHPYMSRFYPFDKVVSIERE
ncbi:MAG: hypothetical protein ACOYI2_06380 [Bacillota bacterium]|jgi:hypothetical protein|nr:hypothetical protein [Clostridia bacterium]